MTLLRAYSSFSATLCSASCPRPGRSLQHRSVRLPINCPVLVAAIPSTLASFLSVYDDYPLVVRTLQVTTDKLDHAEEVARSATNRQEALEQELAEEKKGRMRTVRRPRKRDLASKTAERERQRIRSTEKKVRDELNPRIADLERQLKEMTASRDAMRMDLDNWKEKLSSWTSRMEGMHKEREAALTRDKEAHEKRIALAEKLSSLDEEILASLRLDTRLQQATDRFKGVA